MASFGEDLRRERELRGVGLREIADSTKINIRFLEALENNDFKHLPGGQFNKGFVRAYARHIGLDSEKAVNSYLLEFNRQEEKEKARVKYPLPQKTKKPERRSLMVVLIFIIIVIIAIVIVAFLWSRSNPEGFIGRFFDTIADVIRK